MGGDHADLGSPWTTQREQSLRNEASQVRRLPDKPKRLLQALECDLMVGGTKCSTDVEQSQNGKLGPIDNPIKSEMRHRKRVSMEWPLGEARLAYRKQVIYL